MGDVMSQLIWFALGLFVGANIGFMYSAIVYMAKDQDNPQE